MSIETLMILFVCIEMFQVFFILIQIYKTRQELTRLMQDPSYAGTIASNAIHGFIDQLMEDSKEGEVRRNNFFGIIGLIGRNILASITGQAPGEPAKPVKLPRNMKILEPFVNNPAIQNMIAGKIAEGLGNAGKKAAEKAGESVIAGW